MGAGRYCAGVTMAQESPRCRVVVPPDHLRPERDVAAIDEFRTDWMPAVYDVPQAAARDKPCDGCALDRVFEAYRLSERGVRNGFEDFQRYRRLNGLMLPFLVKLSLAARALARRRRGTRPKARGRITR